MGKGGYNGGSTVIRAAVGFIGRRSRSLAMSPAEIRVDLANRQKIELQRTTTTSRELRKALDKLNPKKAAKEKAANATLEKARRAMQKARRAGVNPMANVMVRRITTHTLRLRRPRDED